MKTFEIGKIYSASSVCDSECVWSYVVVKRTAKTVTLKPVNHEGRELTLKIIAGLSEMRGAESVYPLGRYSMAPIISAN